MPSKEWDLPLTPAEQAEALEELRQSALTIKKYERVIRRLEHDKESLNAMYENAISLRDHNEREKDKQSMYNRILLQVFPSVIFVLDDQLLYTTGTGANIAGKFGFADEKELVARPLAGILEGAADPAWVRKTVENCERVLRTGETVKYTDFVVFRDGEQVHADITITPATQKGEIQGVVFLLDDVTELIRMKEKAEEAARSKSSFLANMSHEIRTPMNAILGMGHLLETTELSEKQKGFLGNMMRASDSLLDIINDILDFSKIDAQRFELVEQTYSLTGLIEDVVNIVKLRASEKGLAFTISIEPSLARTYRGDNIRIKQVLVNLLTNAIKYTREGAIDLEVTHGLEDGRYTLRFAVRDTGIGIREEELGSIFNAFTQVDTKKNRNVEGTGLGLAISHGLALAMNGAIAVESEYGKGSRFSFSVPQQVVDARPLVDASAIAVARPLLIGAGPSADSVESMLAALELRYRRVESIDAALELSALRSFTHALLVDDAAEQAVHAARLPRSLRLVFIARLNALRDQDIPANAEVLQKPVLITGLAEALLDEAEREHSEEGGRAEALGIFAAPSARVLLVDDNEINLLVAEEILKQYGMQVVPVTNGMEALERAKEEPFDLILMDHMMPGMDGVETTKRIRAEGGRSANAPIIALTANAVSGMEAYYLENEMNDFLSKPMDIDKLNAVLLRWIPPEKIEPGNAC
ncbi:response regulator [Eubacteriales bacterium OttesenSCG-928-A19]|nr:response regulator [Eubacteriales bacterium OttesenSCG-928-A19]